MAAWRHDLGRARAAAPGEFGFAPLDEGERARLAIALAETLG